MPSDKFKFNAKKGVTPVIKKLYNTHVKLLGGKSEKLDEGKKSTTKQVQKPNELGTLKSQNDTPGLRGKTKASSPCVDNHEYENVEFGHPKPKELEQTSINFGGLFINNSFSEEVFANVNLSLNGNILDKDLVDHANISVVAVEESGSRYYENVFLPSSNVIKTSSPLGEDCSNEKDNSIILDSSTESNVTVIEVSEQNPDDNKLKAVIDNFDKIISEYSAPKKEKPKLQKSKTCSIIESKCILKKQSCSPSDEKVFRSLELNVGKTKSLFNLDKNWLYNSNLPLNYHSGEGDFWSLELKGTRKSEEGKVKAIDDKKQKVDNVETKKNEFTGTDTVKPKVTKKSESIQKQQPSVKVEKAKPRLTLPKGDGDRLDEGGSKSLENVKQQSPVSVKEVIKKLNSLGEETKSIQRKNPIPDKRNVTPVVVKSSVAKEKTAEKRDKGNKQEITDISVKPASTNNKLQVFELDKDLTVAAPCGKSDRKMPTISRAISCADMTSGSKKLTQSKIPVKKSLSKIFPSTPSDLNCLDRTLRCTPIEFDDEQLQKSISMQNILESFEQNACANKENKSRLDPKQNPSVHTVHGKFGNNKSLSSQNLQKVGIAKKNSLETVQKTKASIEKSKSVQNIHKPLEKVSVYRGCIEKSSSVQNLNKTNVDKGKSSYKSESTTALVKKADQTYVKAKNPKAVAISKGPNKQEGLRTLKNVMGKSDFLNNSEKSKLERALTYNKDPPEKITETKRNPLLCCRDYVNVSKVVSKEEQEFIRKFVENLKTNPNLLEDDKNLDFVLEIGGRKEEREEIHSEVNNLTYLKPSKIPEVANKTHDDVLANKFPSRPNTFGSQKSALEPKFGGPTSTKPTSRKVILKRTSTYNKNDRIREFQQIEKIEQNLKTAKEIFMTTNLLSCEYFNNPCVRANCELKIERVMNILKTNEVQEADVRNDGEVYRSYLKYDFGLNNFDKLKKIGDFDKDIFAAEDKLDNLQVKDYGSDDNSDDSGNISNELELEFDEGNVPTSEQIFSSSESLEENLSKDDFGSDESKTVTPTAPDACEGKSDDEKIFFRSGVLTQLESQRDERLGGMVVNLQAHCRGYLARKKLCQRKLQDLAVRCIQRNVRKFLLVRDWPWWRLLVRVTPLLNVHRTEEELKSKTEELELLKAKLEKLETERTTLKHDNDKLEAKLSEMTADLAEEHSTSTLAAERLDAEQSERVRLERDLSEVQQKNKDLQNASERLEMELLYARSDLNGISEDDEDADGEAVYKQRYERVVRELEFTKRRLQQQHEDDLEQLVGLKKQLEKKLTDAYEEVEEQRQVVGQWKRKVQKLNGEMNDLKLLLEEQSSRNNLLEKKQRKFDSEIQLLQDELKKEKQTRDRSSREKEVVIAEKFTLESNLADVRLELDLKEEKLSALQREFDELTYGGKTEEEVTILRKQKIDCERKMHDQEEELDELAGQVQILEQAKLKLEMTLEQQRKTSKKEAQQHEEELEEVRCNAQKKVKALEAQLENEHEERTLLLREKHELERRLTAALESDRTEKACDEAVLQRLKRDLKRTKALLRDTQAQLERQKAETPNKALIRQLRNQIEDLDCARSIAVKAKQTTESELSETQAQLEEAMRQKSEAEDRANAITREKTDLQTQVEENEEELAEVLKKYKTTIQQMSLDQIALQEQVALVSELEIERNSLKEQLSELTSKLESVESMGDASSHMLVKRTELKVKELESKLDLEQTTRSRLEVQISRLKEAVEKIQNDLTTSRTKEQQAQDQIRKLQRSLRELKDEHNTTLTKESESLLKRKELEKRCETLEGETSTARADLRIALKRIEDLQAVIQNELEDSTENSESDHDSYSSDDSVNTFLVNHKMGTSKSSSMQFDGQRRLSNTSRSSTSSNLAKDSSYA